MEWNELLRGQSADIKALMKKEGATGRYARITISLAEAQADGLLELSGDYIGIASITGDGTCKVRLDHRHAQQIDLREVEEISSPFGKLYFESDGAGGSLVLYIGGALTARLKPVQSKVSLRSVAGADIDPVQDKRFKAHAGGHIKKTLSVADTAEFLSATELKVKWAIIGVEDLGIRWGFTAVARATSIGQKVPAGSFIVVEYCDLSKLKFVNEVAAETPTVQVEYVTEA